MITEVLVIGGGPAGAVAAIRLARSGVAVTLVERARNPSHKVCGEFLSGEALLYLQQLGLDVRGLGAVPMRTVRLAGSRHVLEGTLPFPAMSLTRRCLDGELLKLAELSGVRVRRGCSVEHIVFTGRGWQATLADGEAMHSDVVFLASGKHDVRGRLRPAGKQNGMVAFKMYWRLSPAEALLLGNSVELITYRDGYAGLQPVEDGLANLCCLIHMERLRHCGGGWEQLLQYMCKESPHLRKRLCNAVPQLLRPLTIAPIPYGFIRTESDGLWYLGDQAVVIPSFTGDGMSLALHTGMLAADMYLRNASSYDYQQTVAMQVKRQVTFATAVSRAITRIPRLAMLLPQFLPGVVKVVAQQTRIDPIFRVGLQNLGQAG